jgi:hypothetical protein
MIGWVFYNNTCYQFNIGNGGLWTQCESICSSFGASMLCIPDSTTNAWIANQLNQISSVSYAFIGYRPNPDGTYHWISGCSSNYINWVDDHNASIDDYAYSPNYNDYAKLDKSNGKWYSDSFYDHKTTCSCEYPIPTTEAPSAPSTISPNVGCQLGWSYYDAKCYKIKLSIVNNGFYFFSWSGCRSVCASLGASMLCIPDSTTNSWIANQISQTGYTNSWIGYSDLPNNDGNYEWVSGCSSSYTKDVKYGKDCVYIWAYGDRGGEWFSSIDKGDSQSSAATLCSCEYSIHSLSPTLLPSLPPSGDNASKTIGIVVGCVVFVIIVIVSLLYILCNRTNSVLISTINESTSNNDDISSSNQAYTDIPSIYPHLPTDDDSNNYDDENGDVLVSSSTVELQVIVATNAYYKDYVPIDHEKELFPVAVQI